MTPTRNQSLVALLIIVLFILFIVVGFRANQQATRLAPRAQTTGAGTVSIPPWLKICIAANQTGCIQTFDPRCTTDTDCVTKMQTACSITNSCPSDIQTKCSSGMCQYWQKGQTPPTTAPTSSGTNPTGTTPNNPTTAPVSCGPCDVNGDGAVTEIDATAFQSCIAVKTTAVCSPFGLDPATVESTYNGCKLRACFPGQVTSAPSQSVSPTSGANPTGSTTGTPGSCIAKSNGDINADGKTDLLDFSIWLSEFLNKSQTTNRADTNCDSTVDLNDFNDWRKGATATSFR